MIECIRALSSTRVWSWANMIDSRSGGCRYTSSSDDSNVGRDQDWSRHRYDGASHCPGLLDADMSGLSMEKQE